MAERDSPGHSDGWEKHYEAAGHAIAEGRFADAEAELRTALEFAENTQPVNHRVLDTLDLLFHSLSLQGKLEEAERICRRLGQLFGSRETREYDDFVRAIGEAGFYTAGVEDMIGWDRVTACSKRLPGGGYSGNSFWVTSIDGKWYLGTWGGLLYRVPECVSAASVAIAWMARRPDGTYSDFDDELKSQFSLEPVTDEEFEDRPNF